MTEWEDWTVAKKAYGKAAKWVLRVVIGLLTVASWLIAIAMLLFITFGNW